MPSGDACQTQVCQNSVGFPDCSADLRTQQLRTFLPPGLLVYIALELARDREKHQTDSPASTEGETDGDACILQISWLQSWVGIPKGVETLSG